MLPIYVLLREKGASSGLELQFEHSLKRGQKKLFILKMRVQVRKMKFSMQNLMSLNSSLQRPNHSVQNTTQRNKRKTVSSTHFQATTDLQ